MAYREIILEDTPVSYWRLGEAAGATTAVDEQGLNPGTYSGSTSTAGLLKDADAARDFDGVDDRISIASAASVNLTGGFTLEALIRPDSTTGEKPIIRKAPSTASPYGLDILNGAFRLFRRTTAYQILTAGVASVGALAHAVGTYDGATLRLYVNGALAGSLAAAGTGGVTTDAVFIGHSPSPQWFDGVIDEVALYNYALSAAQVLAHYQAGTRFLHDIGQAAEADAAQATTRRKSLSAGLVTELDTADTMAARKSRLLVQAAEADAALVAAPSFIPDALGQAVEADAALPVDAALVTMPPAFAFTAQAIAAGLTGSLAYGPLGKTLDFGAAGLPQGNVLVPTDQWLVRQLRADIRRNPGSPFVEV